MFNCNQKGGGGVESNYTIQSITIDFITNNHFFFSIEKVVLDVG